MGPQDQSPIFARAREYSLQVGLHAWGRAGKAPPQRVHHTYLEDYIGNQPIAQAQVQSFVTVVRVRAFPGPQSHTHRMQIRMVAGASVAL